MLTFSFVLQSIKQILWIYVNCGDLWSIR